jgi:hypothetical protein
MHCSLGKGLRDIVIYIYCKEVIISGEFSLQGRYWDGNGFEPYKNKLACKVGIEMVTGSNLTRIS